MQQIFQQIFQQIKAERNRQDAKFGEQNHSIERWCNILTEECGEVNKAAIEHWHEGKPLDNYRAELIQVAAVAVSMLQAHERAENAKGLTMVRIYEIEKVFHCLERKVFEVRPDVRLALHVVQSGVNFYANTTFIQVFDYSESYSCLLWLKGAMDTDELEAYLKLEHRTF